MTLSQPHQPPAYLKRVVAFFREALDLDPSLAQVIAESTTSDRRVRQLAPFFLDPSDLFVHGGLSVVPPDDLKS